MIALSLKEHTIIVIDYNVNDIQISCRRVSDLDCQKRSRLDTCCGFISLVNVCRQFALRPLVSSNYIKSVNTKLILAYLRQVVGITCILFVDEIVNQLASSL